MKQGQTRKSFPFTWVSFLPCEDHESLLQKKWHNKEPFRFLFTKKASDLHLCIIMNSEASFKDGASHILLLRSISEHGEPEELP
ncbi:hypothetical protein TNCV_1158331 [Trichonephila clavipes]|nr:hypothetical protein TNCV_1158331 [Trichonephila clavipes]